MEDESSANEQQSWSRTPLAIVGWVLLAGGVAASVWMVATTGPAHDWQVDLLTLLPGAVALAGSWALCSLQARGCWIIGATIVLMLLWLVVVLNGVHAVLQSTTEAYAEMMHWTLHRKAAFEAVVPDWQPAEFVTHFPERIPDDATYSRLWWTPFRIGPGEMTKELLLKVPASRAWEAIEQARQHEKMEPVKAHELYYYGKSAGWIAQAPYSFQADETDYAWGIAADPERGKVIYWYDKW